uniref:Uncharacterized protein n=1 Tax=Arundo donax TaxID=35708 RepID=A0A0A9HKK8_ARUDO
MGEGMAGDHQLWGQPRCFGGVGLGREGFSTSICDWKIWGEGRKMAMDFDKFHARLCNSSCAFIARRSKTVPYNLDGHLGNHPTVGAYVANFPTNLVKIVGTLFFPYVL